MPTSKELFRGFDSNTLLAISRLLPAADQLKFAHLDRAMAERIANHTRLMHRQQCLIDNSIFNISPELFFKDINPTEIKIFRSLVNYAQQKLDYGDANVAQTLSGLLRITDYKEFLNQPVEKQVEHLSQRNPVILIMYQRNLLSRKKFTTQTENDVDLHFLKILDSAITIALNDHPLGCVAYARDAKDFDMKFVAWLAKIAPDMSEVNKTVFLNCAKDQVVIYSRNNVMEIGLERQKIIMTQKILLNWQQKFGLLTRMQVDGGYNQFLKWLFEFSSSRLKVITYQDIILLAENRNHYCYTVDHLLHTNDLVMCRDLTGLMTSEYIFSIWKNSPNREQFVNETLKKVLEPVVLISDIFLWYSNPPSLTDLNKLPLWLLSVIKIILPILSKIKQLNISINDFIKFSSMFFKHFIKTHKSLDVRMVNIMGKPFRQLLLLSHLPYFKDFCDKIDTQRPGARLIKFLSAYEVSYKYIQKFPILFDLLDTAELPDACEQKTVYDALKRITKHKLNEVLLEYILILSNNLEELVYKLNNYPLMKLNSKAQNTILCFFDIAELNDLRNINCANIPNLNMLEVFVSFLMKIENVLDENLIYKIYSFFHDTESTIRFLTAFYPLVVRPNNYANTELLRIIFVDLSYDLIKNIYTLLECEKHKQSQYIKLFDSLLSLLTNQHSPSNTFATQLVKNTLATLNDQTLKIIDHPMLIDLILARVRVNEVPKIMNSLFEPDILSWWVLYNKIPEDKREVFISRFTYICNDALRGYQILWQRPLFSGDLDTFIEWVLNDNYYWIFCNQKTHVQILIDVYGSDWTQLKKIIDSGLLKFSEYNTFNECIRIFSVTDLLLLHNTFATNDAAHTYSLLELIVTSSQFNNECTRKIPAVELIKQKEELFKLYPKVLLAKPAPQLPSSPPVAPAMNKQGIFKNPPAVNNQQKLLLETNLDNLINYLKKVDDSTQPIPGPLQERIETISTLCLRLAKRKSEQEAEPAFPPKAAKLEEKTIEDKNEQQRDSNSPKNVR